LDLIVVLFSVFRRLLQAAKIAGAKQHSPRQGLSPFLSPENPARDGDRVNRVQPEMPDDGNGFGKHASLAGLAWVGSLFFN